MPTITEHVTAPTQGPVVDLTGQVQQAAKQVDSVETQPKAPEATASETPQDPLAPKFAALARKERAIRDQVRKIETERQALKAREAEIENSVNTRWKSNLAQNTWDTLIEAGLTPDQVTQVFLNQPGPVDPRISKLQTEIEALKGQSQQVEIQQAEQAKKQIAYDAKSMASANPKQFGFVATRPEASEAVAELVDITYKETGYVMDMYQAMKEIEDFYVDQYFEGSKDPRVLERLKPFLAPKAPTPEAPKMTNPERPKTTGPTTLSNRMAVNAGTSMNNEKARKARAIAAFLGQLTT